MGNDNDVETRREGKGNRVNEVEGVIAGIGARFGRRHHLDAGVHRAGTPDLRLGLATAPVLYASTEFPELETMIARYIETLCFLKSNGDLELRIDSISLRIQNI